MPGQPPGGPEGGQRAGVMAACQLEQPADGVDHQPCRGLGFGSEGALGALLAAMLRRFLRSPMAAHSGLNNATPAAEAAELERMAEQMRAYARVR